MAAIFRIWNIKHSFNLISNMKRSSQIMSIFLWWLTHRWRHRVASKFPSIFMFRRGWLREQITQTQDKFSLADAPWKPPKYPCFWILPLEFEVNIDIHNMKTVRLYIQTIINLQRKYLGSPDCKNIENKLIYFIRLNVHDKYLIQTILYHFK